jgi:hypothetical protein
MSFSDDLARARNSLPFPDLLRRLGVAVPEGNKPICSPLRPDKHPSFSVVERNGRWRGIDRASGTTWDEVDFIADFEGCSKEDAAKRFLELAGVQREEAPRPAYSRGAAPSVAVPAGPPPTQDLLTTAKASLATLLGKATGPVAFDWQACVDAFLPERRAGVAEWRGWPVEFVDWLWAEKLLGLYQGKIACPVMDAGGKVVSCHYRRDDGDWMFPTGTKNTPLIWGEGRDMVVAFESQWDAFTMMLGCECHLHPQMRDALKVCISRGAGNARSLAPHYLRGSAVGFQQNDKPLAEGEAPHGNHKWKLDLASVWPGVEWAYPPEQYKDLNDWVRADGAEALKLAKEAIMVPKQERSTKLSIHSLWEIDQMELDPDAAWVGENVITEGEACSILGQGGLGKSRWTLQLVAHMILGMNFCGMVVHPAAYGKKWLFLQGENRKNRLKHEIMTLKNSMGLSASQFEFVARRIYSTTLLKNSDFDMDTTDPKDLEEIRKAVADIDPDGVVMDPLGDFSSADLNTDEHMKALCGRLRAVIQEGNTKRVILFVHHALTGKEGASRAVGWDASSFGRGSKGLYNKVRSQINIAPLDPEDTDKLIVACGKCNNGKQFKPFGIVLREDGLYEWDEDFSLDEWKERLASDGKAAPGKVKIPPSVVRDAVPMGGISKEDLVKRLAESFGVSISLGKVALEAALADNQVRIDGVRGAWRVLKR